MKRRSTFGAMIAQTVREKRRDKLTWVTCDVCGVAHWCKPVTRRERLYGLDKLGRGKSWDTKFQLI